MDARKHLCIYAVIPAVTFNQLQPPYNEAEKDVGMMMPAFRLACWCLQRSLAEH